MHQGRSLRKSEEMHGASRSIFRKERGCAPCNKVDLSERPALIRSTLSNSSEGPSSSQLHQGENVEKSDLVASGTRSLFRKERGCCNVHRVALSERTRLLQRAQGRSFGKNEVAATCTRSLSRKERGCCNANKVALSERATLLQVAQGRSFGKNEVVALCTRPHFPRCRPLCKVH